MRRGKIYDWLPLWRNKWLMGSTRWELSPAERSVFIDFLCLASADDGFIRANPTTPYPIEYLAGLLQAPAELIREAIEKCIAVGKITRLEDGIMFINSWPDYQIAPREKRRIMQDKPEDGKTDTLDLDDTERSSYKADEIDRERGINAKSNLDKEIEKMRAESAKLEAEAKAKGVKL
jgi:hypothetical protein